MLKLDQISPSRIKTYETCLYKYYLTYIAKLPLKSNFGAANGSLIHNILESYTNQEDNDWLKRLSKGFAGELEIIDKDEMIKLNSPLTLAKDKEFKLIEPECDECEYTNWVDNICGISKEPLDKLSGCPKFLFEVSKSIIEDTISRYNNIWNRILTKDNKKIGIEYEFFIPILDTQVLMHGLQDLVVLDDEETIHIYDYKAGKKTQNYTECKEDIQVKMYSLAARREFIDDINHKGFKFKNVLLTFDYFRDKPITLAFSKEEDDKTEKLVKEKIFSIKNTNQITRIVPDNVDWEERGPKNSWRWWKCKFMCDTKTCSENWKGNFSI